MIRSHSALDHLVAGRARARRGEFEEAVRELDRAIAQEPDSAEAHRLRGGVLGRLGRHAAALADHDRAIELGRPDAAVLNDRGVTHLLLGNVGQAVEDWRRAIALAPGEPAPRANLRALARAIRRDGTRTGRMPGAARRIRS